MYCTGCGRNILQHIKVPEGKKLLILVEESAKSCLKCTFSPLRKKKLHNILHMAVVNNLVSVYFD